MKKLLITILMLAVLSPLGASAQTANPTYTPLEPLPCIPGAGVTCTNGAGNPTGPNRSGAVDFQNYVQFIFNLIIAIAAAAAIFMIVLGGLQYMTSDSWTGKSDGLGKLKNALLGLVLVLTSYLILRTVDPRLVAIPSTLVEPLKIPSQQVNLSYLDGFVASQAAQFLQDSQAAQQTRATNLQTLATVNRQISNINDRINTLVSTLGNDTNTELAGVTPSEICSQNTFTPTCTPEACSQLYAACLELTRKKTEVETTTKDTNLITMIGRIDAALATCKYDTSSNVQACRANIAGITGQTSASAPNLDVILNADGRKTVLDYQKFADAFVTLNVELMNPFKGSPSDFFQKNPGTLASKLRDTNVIAAGIQNCQYKERFLKARNDFLLGLKADPAVVSAATTNCNPTTNTGRN